MPISGARDHNYRKEGKGGRREGRDKGGKREGGTRKGKKNCHVLGRERKKTLTCA
jgi:hypothetical protein